MKMMNKFCALMLSVALCAGMAAPAFAYGGEPVEEVEQPVLTSTTDEEDVVTVTDEETGALTPEGNLTLVDDYHTSYSDGSGQQFITLVSKSGNTFYLVIDRNDKGENTVHFMNLVDEADLLSLMEDEDADAYTAEKEAAAQAEQDRLKAEEEAKKAAEEAAEAGETETEPAEDSYAPELVFEELESIEIPEETTRYKTNVALLILYLIFAIPISAVLIVLALAVAVVLVALGVSLITIGVEAIGFAFAKLVIFADIMLCAGAVLITFAVALILLWIGVLVLVRGISGIVRGAKALGRSFCVKEVPDNE